MPSKFAGSLILQTGTSADNCISVSKRERTELLRSFALSPQPPAMPSSSLAFACTGVSASSSAVASLPSHDLLFHASGPTVAVLSTAPRTPIVTFVLPTRPTARVAAVAAAASPSGEILVCAALSDGHLCVFTRALGGAWTAAAPVEATGGGKAPTPLVSASAVWHGRFYCVTAAMDDARGAGLVAAWGVGADDGVMQVAKTQSPRGVDFLPECLDCRVVEGVLVVAVGGTDRVVHVYERVDGVLEAVVVLPGHRDWVRGMRFGGEKEHEFLLASASTDATVRIWKFRRTAEAAVGEDADNEEHRASVTMKIGGVGWVATLDALLSEHDRPVLAVDFAEEGESGMPTLLTASMDGSVAVWKPRVEGKVNGKRAISEWCTSARFGLLGGAETAALGFSSAVFVNTGVRSVFAHTLNGSVHFWRREEAEAEDRASGSDDFRFLAENAPGGHVMPVTSVAWEPRGRFLMSCSEDKTTRAYVPFPKDSSRFVEWSRPQVHGHALRDIAFMAEGGRSFASVSDEKVIRLFDAPTQFDLPGQDSVLRDESGALSSSAFGMEALSASIPELGLSNKAIYAAEGEGAEDDGVGQTQQANNNLVNSFGDDMLLSSFGADKAAHAAPLDIELRQDRLWPERAKLYGHGNDAFCISVDLNHGILASASRAQASRDAFIILWDIESGVEKQRLFSHDLTINQLKFTSNGEALLSVSRDRSFAVFARVSTSTDGGAGDSIASKHMYSLAARQEESHGRLLHSGCWMFGQDIVATGSRDKHLKLWRFDQSSVAEVYKRKFSTGISALDACPGHEKHCQLLAVGLEDGSLLVERVVFESGAVVKVSSVVALSNVDQSCGRVNMVAWRPACASRDIEGAMRPTESLQLAMASSDCSVRVVNVLP